ncbi:MAG: hypothetical protein HFE98_06705 [Ruminiclostridium sp.]|nr:hypothetical protein [Ruminiclostridium sp.]
MKYAHQLSDMFNAFSPEPLNIDQLAEFYCTDTMEQRMSDKYTSPMEDIFDLCQEGRADAAFLLLGHRGCGKSTELNRLSERFLSAGHPVKTIQCSVDLDLLNMAHADLFILMAEALVSLAAELHCDIGADTLSRIETFWAAGTESWTTQEAKGASIEAGLSTKTPGILSTVLALFVDMKADLKYNEEKRTEYRKTLNVRTSEWVQLLRTVAAHIAQETGGKQPVLIFEDLDKLNPEDAWKVFYHYAAILSGMPFPVIYTFPIALSYDPRFSAMESYFIIKTLPMIKIETIEGQPFQEGIQVIKEIVKKRAKVSLFDSQVLETIIQYTGGSLRDLFHSINTAAKRAQRRGAAAVSMEDADRALEELQTSLTRRIEADDYDFLTNIYNGNKERIQEKERLLKLLQASVVLEYNGKRWHNVHPLVVKFLRRQEIITDDRA